MPDILLTTLNAKYIHAAFGLRYLMANLGGFRFRAAIAEFDINQRSVEIAGTILGHHSRFVEIGVYIWDVAPATELVVILRAARPDLVNVLGGPEVSYECDRQEIVRRSRSSLGIFRILVPCGFRTTTMTIGMRFIG